LSLLTPLLLETLNGRIILVVTGNLIAALPRVTIGAPVKKTLAVAVSSSSWGIPGAFTDQVLVKLYPGYEPFKYLLTNPPEAVVEPENTVPKITPLPTPGLELTSIATSDPFKVLKPLTF